MRYILPFICLVMVSLPSLSASSSFEEVQRLVDLFTFENTGITNAFQDPASDIAQLAHDDAWFALYVFLPFLILPQLLLIYVIFKYRDRGPNDTRKPATFLENHKLEITYTIIPVIALIIVAVPITQSLYITEHAPEIPAGKKNMVVEVIAKQFEWKYRYPGKGDFIIARNQYAEQLPVVLVKDWVTQMRFTSEDVQHAWSVPSFGIKKDCYPARYNDAWFTPNRAGDFEGQCYELCGADHGRMIVSAIVLEDENDFYQWVVFQNNQNDTFDIVEGVRGLGDDETPPDALRESVTGYLAKEGSQARQDSLLYWLLKNYEDEAISLTIGNQPDAAAAIRAEGKQRFDILFNLIAETAATNVAAMH